MKRCAFMIAYRRYRGYAFDAFASLVGDAPLIVPDA
jgi:hypothetical protein